MHLVRKMGATVVQIYQTRVSDKALCPPDWKISPKWSPQRGADGKGNACGPCPTCLRAQRLRVAWERDYACTRARRLKSQ